MAKLEAIFISGIRSYGIDKSDAQYIKFDSPVTLFLGQNGCGKTTIIECVKHALTGDFPFSSKTGGQSFVADPHVHSLRSIKGCIKLKFIDCFGNPAMINRILKLDVMDDKMKCTSDDASYTYFDSDGEKHEIRAKLADCKSMIKTLVGVSEAVLNNVLFCHQEDSLWPLSEDGIVKKKFDQIFDCSAADTAIDLIIKQTNESKLQVKDLSKELYYLRELTENARARKANLDSKEESLKLLQEEYEACTNRCVPLKKKLDDVIALEASFSTLHKMKSTKEIDLVGNRKFQQELRTLLKSVFKGTDEELEHEIQNFSECVKQKQQQLQKLNHKLNKLDHSLRDNNVQMQTKSSALATIEEQINNYMSKVKERNQKASRILEATNSQVNEDFETNLKIISGNLTKEKADIQQLEGDMELFEETIQTEIDAVQEKLMQVKSYETVKRREQEAAIEEKRDVDDQLVNLSSSEDEFRNFETKISRLQAEIDSILSSFNEEDLTRKIEGNKKKSRDFDHSLEEYDRDMKLFMKNSMIEKEIQVYQSDKYNKEAKIRKIRSKHHNTFKALFENNIPAKDLRVEVEKIRARVTRVTHAQERDLNAKEKSASNLNAVLSVKKNDLSNVTNELQKSRESIKKYCAPNEFEDKLTKVIEDIRLLNKEKGQLDAFKIMYNQFVKQLAAKKCCPLCDSDFSGEQNKMKSLTETWNDKILNVPERLKEVASSLEKNEKLRNELTQLKPVHAKLERIETDLKTKQQDVEATETNYKTIQNELTNLRAEIKSGKSSLELCNQLGPDAAVLDQCAVDIEQATLKITEFQRKLFDIPSKCTKATLETLIEVAKEEKVKLNDENERLTKKITASQKRLHECRTQKAEVADAQANLQATVQDKPQLIVKQIDLQSKIEELAAIIESAENDSSNATRDYEIAKQRLSSVKQEHSKTLKSMQKTLQENEAGYIDLQRLIKEIRSVEAKNLDAERLNLTQIIDEMRKKNEEIDEDMSGLFKSREALKEELHDQDNVDKNLQNNKKLRAYAKKEVELEEMIKSLAAEMNVSTFENIDEEKFKLQSEYSDIRTQMATIDGQMKNVVKLIAEIQADIALYKMDPSKSFKKKLLGVIQEKKAVADLQRITKSVSIGISKYHKEKLLTINKRLKQLWREIYRGNDIDYIQIVSGETNLSRVRRQFTYCLMQKRNDAIVPMRGKCSAGQRVLACLLLRIVLAEHFSSDCGIFALDEPTTNLDRENIRSLSECIARLITSEKTKNFQFLIITHDADFLDALREADAIREYYDVSRNNNGNSIITKMNI